jgi:pimeloyl-ACP methyl ester carboxylesterase
MIIKLNAPASERLLIVYSIRNNGVRYTQLKKRRGASMALIIPFFVLGSAPIVGTLLYRKIRQQKVRAAMRIQSSQGIAEERFVPVGGIPQWISIRGEDRKNPAILVIHGGPGASCSIFTPLIRSWEHHFTVVQWDQRGSGKTLSRTGKRGSGELTAEALVRDGIELAEFLCRSLQTEKIVLMACSSGSTFGLSMVQRRPDLFAAYVGTDQNVGMKRGHDANYRAVIDRLRSLRLQKGVAALTHIGSEASHWTAKDYATISRWTMKSDPRPAAAIMKLLKSSIWYSPGHTLRDICTFVVGMNFSLEQLVPDLRSYDAWQGGTHFAMPFFIFQGENDLLTPHHLAKAFFDDVVAPIKHMVLIRGAGHFAAFLQPQQFLHELLTHVRPVAISQDRAYPVPSEGLD